MTLLLLVALALAQDCPTELEASALALESAATSLEVAATSLETMEREIDALDLEIEIVEDDLDDAEDLLELIHQASMAAPDQPVGAWQAALACYFDDEACPPEGEAVIPSLPVVDPAATDAKPQKKPFGRK